MEPLNYHLVMIVLLLIGVHHQSVAQAPVSQAKSFGDIISIIKDPVDKVLTAIGNKQCAHVKRLVGVEYDQIADSALPGLNRLSLNFRSKDLKFKIPLNSAARLLSDHPALNHGAKLIIYIHGFTDDPWLGPNFKPISDAFLKTGEYNILGLDASSLIRLFYLRSTTCVRLIGERLGEVLATIVNKGLDPKSIHLIGHSLGSHVAGFTGKQFQQLTGSKVGRISGLDPAGPCFSLLEPQLRLQASDADFVDVIHTDSGVFGITEPIGHVDFYPNGGSSQPGCLTQTCSHLRVNRLFAESVLRPGSFGARACASHAAFLAGWCEEDVALMGYGCKSSTRGVYYLSTAARAPYALGARGLSPRTLWNN